jgi:hypothetical protein
MHAYSWNLTKPTPEQLRRIYASGFPGAPIDPGNHEELLTAGLVRTFSDACPHLAGLHRDRPRVELWRSRERFDPGAFGDESQQTGDCVGHGSRSARDVTRSVEIAVAGEPEQYKARGAMECTYGARGHGGAGMDPGRAARFEVDWGFLLRQNYPDLGIDLSRYNPSLAIGWGRSGVPSRIKEACKALHVGEWIFPESGHEALDLLAAGYACHSGQNIGFSARPDSRGIHTVDGRWNHDMATVGYDFTGEVWPVKVVFVPNSWAAWNRQWADWPVDRLGPPITGMITMHLDVWLDFFVGSRSIYFYSDVTGVPAKTLPDWGTGAYL